MRIASQCLNRQRDHLSTNFLRRHFPIQRLQSTQHTSHCWNIHHGTRFFSSISNHLQSSQDADRGTPTSTKKRNSLPSSWSLQPAEWAAKLDKYLPSAIEGVFPKTQKIEDQSTILELNVTAIWRIVYGARKKSKVELFEWMIENGYEKAAVWLIGELLRQIEMTKKKTSESPPSNLSWPKFSLLSRRADQKPALVNRVSHRNFEAIEHGLVSENHQLFRTFGGPSHALLNTVWSTLGHLILKAADLDALQSPNFMSGRFMSAVFLILGHIHRFGFMPDDIYAYKPSSFSSFVQRPPILHLVSSRILTSLSDATWRDLQGDAIAQASARGISLERISQAVPGSRFSVRVRDMGPEVWLELILWCCVESGLKHAAVSIIQALQERQSNPWFAVRWNPSLSHDSYSHGENIDWNKVKLRTGGTVGSIEGYSLEKPLVDIPPRTISVEVVLAVIELCINTCNSHAENGLQSGSIDVIQSQIAEIIAFLEPHDLPPEYFDYLGSRLMFATSFSYVESATFPQKWVEHLQNMQKLETIRSKEATAPDLSLRSILSHSQHLSGVQQQALGKLIQIGDVHNSLQLFNDIQERIDQNKFDAIMEFLQTQPAPSKGFFSARPLPDRLEYVDSYGQVPYYRLAAFLNLLSDNKLTGMGQWLIYADEVDGAVIPPSAYKHTSLTAALLKFASVSGDENLRHSVLSTKVLAKKLPTVRVLREMVNTNAHVQDFQRVQEFLKSLKPSEGGGAGLDNIVHLAATLLRLENNLIGKKERKAFNVETTTRYMKEILRGRWDTVYDTFPTATRKRFLQNIAHVLRMFAYAESSVLQSLARSFIERFPPSTLASLPTQIFNELFSAMVDVYGSVVGREMWTLFCGDVDASDLGGVLDASTDDLHDDASDQEVQIEPQLEMSTPYRNLRTDRQTKIQFGEADTISESVAAASTSYYGQSYEAVTESLAEMNDHGNASPGNSPQALQTEDLHDSPDLEFDNPFFKTISDETLSRLLRPMVITRPNMQTIRIIVRAAVKEKQERTDAGLRSPRQDKILAWAYYVFKSVAAADEKVIEQEIQQPVSSLAEEISRYMEMLNEQTQSASSPRPSHTEYVSPLWSTARGKS